MALCALALSALIGTPGHVHAQEAGTRGDQGSWSIPAPVAIEPADGGAWFPQPSTTTDDLYSVWGADADNIWAVGARGAILKWNGSTWSRQSNGTMIALHGVWGTDRDNVWAVGDNGTIFKWNGRTWIAQFRSTPLTLNDVWGTDANHIWAVGGAIDHPFPAQVMVILAWDGTQWRYNEAGGAEGWLYGVWGTDANNVWAVGGEYDAAILKWNGSSWGTESIDTGSYFYDVWGADANNIWAVGGDIVAGGAIAKWDGSTWTAQASGTRNVLRGVWGTDASHVWAVGDNGTILRWDGSVWRTEASGTPHALNAVGGAPPQGPLAMGSGGTIWGTRAFYPLSVARSGAGQGTVTSNPAGIDCGADCAVRYPTGAVITLTAMAGELSAFDGWSGDCAGAGPCIVLIDAARSITATFVVTDVVAPHSSMMYYGPQLTVEQTAMAAPAGAVTHMVIFTGAVPAGVSLAGVAGSEPYVDEASAYRLVNRLLQSGCAAGAACTAVHCTFYSPDGTHTDRVITAPVLLEHVYLPIVSRPQGKE
jgi:hypothetical protein